MEGNLLHLTKTPENTSCCPHLCTSETEKKIIKTLTIEMMRTSRQFCRVCSRSVCPSSLPPLGPVITRICSGWTPRSYGPPYNMGFHDCPHFQGRIINLGEALLPWPNMCPTAPHRSGNSAGWGMFPVALHLSGGRAGWKTTTLKECSMPPGLHRPAQHLL